MKKYYLLICLLFATAFYGQTFNGSTGSISDDGTVNDYAATVSGLASNLSTDYGLVQVCMNISHTYDSDLNVTLISPSGATINLFSGVGGGGHNFTTACLNQSAPASIITGSAPFNGTFRPQETLGNANNNSNGNGVWKLRILDTYPMADTGTVNSWAITFGADASAPFVFTSSNLPIVIINTGGIPIPDEPKIAGTMGVIYNGVGMTNYVTDVANNYNGNIGIEMRGNYSQGLPQKPYKFETRNAAGEELNASLLGLPAEHDWCLIANYNDKVFMRNTMAYDLFTEMGHYATRSQYCEVMLNGNYQGVYMLMETIKRDGDRVDIAKLETTENTGLNVTGGYIIKNDYWDSSDSWLLNFHPIGHPDYDVHLVYDYPKPEDITPQQKTYIQTFINDFETALYGPNYADPVNGYNKYIDTDSFIDYFIINELSRNNDGFKKSSYFHKDIDTATGLSKLKAGPVWDFDWAWKNIPGCLFGATDGSGWAYQVNDCGPDVNSPGWYVRLLQDSGFQDKLRCRWEYFRTTILSNTAIENHIDETAAYLNQAQERHFEKWGNLGLNTGTPEVDADPATFPAQIAKFKDWINLRLAWLDANIPGNIENCSLLAVSGNKVLEAVTLYPNPVSEVLHINSKQAQKVAFFDVTGKLVMEVDAEKNSAINVSSLSNGIYICKITASDAIVKMQKIAVMH